MSITTGPEKWKLALRQLAPSLGRAGLEALALALRADDPRLCRNVAVRRRDPSVVPIPPDEEPLACCAIGYAGWQGHGLKTVAEVVRFYDAALHAAEDADGYGADERKRRAPLWAAFTNFFDDPQRDGWDRNRLLLAEVEAVLAEGGGA